MERLTKEARINLALQAKRTTRSLVSNGLVPPIQFPILPYELDIRIDAPEAILSLACEN